MLGSAPPHPMNPMNNAYIAQMQNLHKRLHLTESDAKSHTVRVGDIRAARGL